MAKDLSKKLKKLKENYKSMEDPIFIKSGSIVLDALLGGGIPQGTYIVWSSESGIGKSTGSLVVSLSYCNQGKKVLYLDPEGGVNWSQLDGIGLTPHMYDEDTNPDGNFYYYRIQTFRDAEEFLDELIEDVDLIVIDSITSLLPTRKKEASSEDILPGMDSAIASSFLRKYKADSVKFGTSFIFINQMRTKIQFLGASTNQEAGGNALKFYPDIRIMMKEARGGKLEREEETASGRVKVPYGSINEIWCIKSRYSRPFVPLKFTVIYGKGVSNLYAYKDFLENGGKIKKAGGWYSIDLGNEPAKVQGINNVLNWIKDNKDLVQEYISSVGGYNLLLETTDRIPEVNEDPDGEPFIDGGIIEGSLDDSYDESLIDVSEEVEEGMDISDVLE